MQIGASRLNIYFRSGKKWPNKFSKVISRGIVHDKETLYDNILKLKQYSNGLLEENIKLKGKINQNEEELIRKNKLINGLIAQMENQKGMTGIQRLQKEV